jgi:hypothetical protein
VREKEMYGEWCSMEEKRNSCRVLVGSLKERNHLEGRGVDERMILKRIFKKYGERMWTRCI